MLNNNSICHNYAFGGVVYCGDEDDADRVLSLHIEYRVGNLSQHTLVRARVID